LSEKKIEEKKLLKNVLARKVSLRKAKSKKSFNGFIDENQFAPSLHVTSQ